MITIVQFPPHKLRFTETDLCGWIGQAAPGEALEYYRGFLALDTFSQARRLTERELAVLTNRLQQDEKERDRPRDRLDELPRAAKGVAGTPLRPAARSGDPSEERTARQRKVIRYGQ